MTTAVAAKPIRAGVFSTVAAADRAVSALTSAGFSHDQITVMCSDETRESHFREYEHQKPAGTFTPGAAAAGSALGALAGGLTAVAGLVTSGGAVVLAAGGIATWTGAVLGGLIGAMMTRGVEKELANFYDQSVAAGKILVAVEVHDPEAKARLAEAGRIIDAAGAEPVPLMEG